MRKRSSSKPVIILILFGGLCLLIPAMFITLHLTSPSDSMRLTDKQTGFTPQGLILTPYSPNSYNLQDGDILLGVAGKNMETWAENLYNTGIVRPTGKHGEIQQYTIQRNDQILIIAQPLVRFPLGAVISNYWGVILFAFVSQIIALFVLIKKPNDQAARALFIWAFSGSHTYAWSFFLQANDVVGGLGFWLFRAATPGLWILYWAATLHVALVFPKPVRFLQKKPNFIAFVYLSAFILYFMFLGWAWSSAENTLDWLNSWATGESLIAGLYLMLTMGTIIYQFRTTKKGSERIKIRWAFYGALVSGITGLVFWIIYPLITGSSLLSANMLGILMLPFPISIAIAIARYNLFDIDVIIQRTLVYGFLTTSLVIFYLISVVLLQQFFRSLTGQTNSLAIVISTLIIAGLFNPMRKIIQKAIDQRFYRRKYDAEKTLDKFNKYSQGEVDLNKLSRRLITISMDTFQPDHLSLWIKEMAENSHLTEKIK